MKPQKYTKRPVTIEAMQWDGIVRKDHPVTHWVNDNGGVARYSAVPWPNQQQLTIETLEGVMTADAGDFIIKGVQGEFYPCKPDIFHLTYDTPNETR